MGLFKKLKKAVKSVRKTFHLPAITLGNVAKVGAAVGTGGLGAGALALGTQAVRSKLKNAAVGGVKQILKTKAEKAVVEKVKKLLPKIQAPNTASPALTMPGGAPLTSRVLSLRKKAASNGKASKRRRKATGVKRKAPTGGKDFKALSASWKAAGKPGTWLAWVKGH